MPTIIKCVVADKRVVEVLRALKPFALDPPVADPMDLNPLNGTKRQIGGPSIRQRLADRISALAKKGVKTIAARELSRLCVEFGGSTNSYSYGLKTLLDDGKLKKTKTPSVYEVVK